jgi:hypothetical protein
MFSWKPAFVAAAALFALAAISFQAPSVLAASGTMRIDAGQQPVPPGALFTIKLLQNADVETSGASTSLRFDPALMQIVEVAPGPDYADATFLIGVLVDTNGDGEPDTAQTSTEAIDEANQTGYLKNVTMFILPGSGITVPTGERVIATITLNAVSAGSAQLSLAEGCVSNAAEGRKCGDGVCVAGECQYSELLDATGEHPIAPDTSAGSATVTISGDAPPPSTPGAGTTGTPAAATTGTAAGSATARPAVTSVSTVAGISRRPDISNTILSVSPATQSVAQATEFKIEVKQSVTVATKGAEAEVKFKSDLLQIVKAEPGSSWTKATGAGASDLQRAIDDANKTGTFKAALLFTGSDTVKEGESTVLTLTMKGKDGKNGKSAIELLNVTLTDAQGQSLQATSQSGEVIVGSGGSGGSSMIWLILAIVAAVVIVGGGGGAYIMRRRKTWA